MTHKKLSLLLLACVLIQPAFSQVPILNSNPSATSKVIYLDFDGQKVVGTSWNNGNLINAAPSTVSNANKIVIWKRVSEDYRPFDVNVTTDSTRFNNALPNKRIRVIFTPTSSWYGSAGGVAYVGSFAWGGTPGTPCWVFENQLGYSAKNMAEAAAHEAGHTLSLRHQSIYNSSCTKTNEYHPGIGTGVTSWAPIMGVGYSKNVTIWHNGTSATSCNTIQNDHNGWNPGITGNAYLSYLPDDIGNTYTSAKLMNLNTLVTADSGIITQPTDIDAFKFTICSNRYVTFSVKPFALDTVNYSGANLDIRLHIYDDLGNLIGLDTTLSRLHVIKGMTLTPGSYYFTVDGGRSANYSDYGSLGKYFVSIRATNPPTLSSAIITTSLCAGQNATLSSSSTGLPNNWQWTVSGPMGTSLHSGQNPVVSLAAGINTITLISSNSTQTSCPYTSTVNVGVSPQISVTGAQQIACPGNTTTLQASGALSYTWMPGGIIGAGRVVSPTVTTSYTVTGANSTCKSSSVVTLTVSPPFTVAIAASQTFMCIGETMTLSASGASGYTFQPGILVGNTFTVSPAANTNYIVYGNVGPCIESASIFISVAPDPTVSAVVSEDFVCAGGQVVITSSGASTYTVDPGGFTGNPVVVTPTVTTNFTITGASGDCSDDENLLVTVAICDVGIHEHSLQQPVIFPNPVKERLFIGLLDGSTRLSLVNSLGMELQRFDVKDRKELSIDTRQLSAGIYFIRIAYGDSGTTYSRFIRE